MLIAKWPTMQSRSRTINCNESPHARPGDGWAQGDLLLVCLETLPQNIAPMIKPDPQLAPGNSQGSRHCLDSLQGVRLFQLVDATPLDGPVILAEREFTVQHPEHGDITLPAGVWGVVYQRAFADELRRVQD